VRRAEVYQTGTLAGYLTETESKGYRFDYLPGYRGHPISLTMPVRPEPYQFENLPPFFEGLALVDGLRLYPVLILHTI
jgi:serine/threonine-protein kinase HipA